MSAQQLIDADKAFNDMAQKEGTGKAFIAYAADDPILIRQGNTMPLVGRTDFVEAFSGVTGSNLSWEPLRAEIAESQDLGYTFGRYTLRENGVVKTHGVYVSIWKKQLDGSWKFVLDGGAATPEQVAKPD
jgi:ketosteroid isomerase-like protein